MTGVGKRGISYSTYTSALDSPVMHHTVGRAHTQIRAAAAVANAAVARLDQCDADGIDLTPQEGVQYHTDVAYVWDACAAAVETLLQASGASAIMKRLPLQLIARNARAGSMHAAYNLDTWLENLGRDLCDVTSAPTSTSVLERRT